MSEFTKGEWRVSGPGSGLQYNVQTETEHIAVVSHHVGGDSGAAANARLIAAAPELLALLKRAATEIDRCRSLLAGRDQRIAEQELVAIEQGITEAEGTTKSENHDKS